MPSIRILAMSSLLVLVALQPSRSQVTVGTIAGQVKLVGPVPASPPPAAVKPADAAVCGTHQSDESVVVGSGGSLKNVIVYLEDAPATATGTTVTKTGGSAPTAKLTNHNCRFLPHIQTAVVGSTLLVGNDDNILHNTHAYLEQNVTLFNIGLPFQGVEVPRRLTRPGMVYFKCDAGHTWMSAYVLVFNHRLHTVSDSSGHFRLESVPPGPHRLKVWHEKFGTQTLNVVVSAGQEVQVNVEYKS